MDQQTGGVPLGSPSGSPAGGRGSEEQKVLPPGEEVMVSDPVVTGGEEVGEEPQLPKEPCYGRPAPLGYRLGQMLRQLAALGAAASAALRSLRERGSAGLRGASSKPELEETSPVDQAQAQSASISAEVSPLTAEKPNPPPSDSVDTVADSATENSSLGDRITTVQDTGEVPQLPKEPCAAAPQSAFPSSLKKIMVKAAAAGAAAALLLKDFGGRGMSKLGVSRSRAPEVEAGVTGNEQTSSLPTLASPLDVKQPGNPIPHPDEVAAGEKLV